MTTSLARDWDCDFLSGSSQWAHPWLGIPDHPGALAEHEDWQSGSLEVEEDEVTEAEPVREDLLTAVRHMVRLLSMPPGWDSYGGKPIDRQKATAALALVGTAIEKGAPMPAIVPTSDGSVQLEWHRRGVDLEIRATSETSFEVFFEDLATGETSEVEIGTDLAPLRAFLDRVTG